MLFVTGLNLEVKGLSMMHYACIDCIIDYAVFNMLMFNYSARVSTFSV